MKNLQEIMAYLNEQITDPFDRIGALVSFVYKVHNGDEHSHRLQLDGEYEDDHYLWDGAVIMQHHHLHTGKVCARVFHFSEGGHDKRIHLEWYFVLKDGVVTEIYNYEDWKQIEVFNLEVRRTMGTTRDRIRVK